MNGSDREWQMLLRQLDRIEQKVDRKLDRTDFEQYKKDVHERTEQLEDDIGRIKEAAVSPDQVTTMVGEGMRQAEARGWTQRDRFIRYGLALLSVGTFVLLVLDRWHG